MFADILTAFNIFDRVYKGWKYLTASKPDTIYTRFIKLFESHGVHRNQIPRFLGHGLTIKDLQDEPSLIAKLDETLMEATCKLFAVRREWLEGAEAEIYPEHGFYKKPEEFRDFLNKLLMENPDHRIRGYLICPKVRNAKREPAILIFEEQIGDIGEKSISRFHLCNNWDFSYWKARGYLTACVAMAWKSKVYVYGRYASTKDINKLAFGEEMLSTYDESVTSSISKGNWYAEDMALTPEAYLNGVDPEMDNFGLISGLEMWLRLDEQGLMQTGLNKNVRQHFEAALDGFVS